MSNLLNIKEASEYLNVHPDTLRRWDKEGKLVPVKTDGGHRRYQQEVLDEFIGIHQKEEKEVALPVATYSRVSSHEQKAKGDLDRQSQRLSEYCAKKKIVVGEIIKDVGSGLSDTRSGFMKLTKLVIEKKISKIIIEHKDRLTRFQFGFIERMFNSYGVEIICVEKVDVSEEEELVNDIMMLMASFSGKLYGKRSASATANVQGGSGNYSFSWNDNQNQTTQTADNLCSGSYTVTIIDNVYGCTTNSNINISQPDQISVTYQSIPSTNGDGQIDVNVSGGVPPYSYSWTNTSGFNSNSEDLQNLYAGTYTLVATDANGCQESVDVTVGGVVGLNNSEIINFNYSPNPCNDYLNISLNGKYNINIYDMSGKVALNTFFVDNKVLDVTSLDNGSYIIHIYNSEVNFKRNLIKQ